MKIKQLKKKDYYLRYNLIAPSVSPREFFATHLYVPKSVISTFKIVNFITTLYALSTVVSVVNLSPVSEI